MAIYHFNIRMICRSKGQSAVSTAAYRSASKLRDFRIKQSCESRRRRGVFHAEILAPEGAPDWIFDRELLWNKVEEAEKRCNSQIARHVLVAVPRELSEDGQVKLVRSFAMASFVERGMVCDFAIHRGGGSNPNASLLLTTRELCGGSFQRKRRDWNGRGMIVSWRKEWADYCNDALERAGSCARVDHRSLLEQGIDLEPIGRLGIPSGALLDPKHERLQADKRDITKEAIERQKGVMARNSQRVLADPEMAIRAMTKCGLDLGEDGLRQWLGTRVSAGLLPECVLACLNHLKS
jgi:hypothetical protein